MEKGVKINNTKAKKITAIALSLMVIFLSANAYAATKGYNNIFFIIKNFVNSEIIANKSEILSDRDITISYQPIEVTNNLKLQINKLVIKEKNATLFLKVDENISIEVYPKQYAVYDITNGKKEELGRQNANRKDTRCIESCSYTEEIKLNKFRNDTKLLELEVFDNNGTELVTFEIDLEKKEIDVLNSRAPELEKIPETELKEILGLYATLNRYDAFSDPDFYSSKEEANKERLVENAIRLIQKRENYKIRKDGYSKQEVHDVIKEMCGKTIKEPINLKYSPIIYNKKTDKYEWSDEDVLGTALCLDIQDINFYNGIYIVDYVYCFASESDFMANNGKGYDMFITTMKLKINDNYKYAKYCLTNIDEIIGEPYFEDYKYNINSKTNNVINNVNEYTNNWVNNGASNNWIYNGVNNNCITNDWANNTTHNNNNIDNYASTMKWKKYTSPGFKLMYPAKWNMQNINEDKRGSNQGGVATLISGVATGIDKETDRILNSNVSIVMSEPRFIEGYSSVAEYIAELNNIYNNGYETCGRETEKTGSWYDYYIETDDQVSYESIHVEETNDEGVFIEYKITISYDGEFNYKVVNILNWFFGELEFASF